MAQMQIQTAELLIDTYRKAIDAWRGEPYPLNIAPTIAAVDAGLAEIARIRGLPCAVAPAQAPRSGRRGDGDG